MELVHTKLFLYMGVPHYAFEIQIIETAIQSAGHRLQSTTWRIMLLTRGKNQGP